MVDELDRASGTTDSGPLTSSLVWATWALFVGLGIMLAGAGLFATVVGIRAESEGFPTLVIGALSAAYYLGFLVGSRVALRVLNSVGHIRVYAALASVLTALILLAGLFVQPVAWIGLRLLAGACLAGQYVVAESWLNQIVTNAQRARVLSIYALTTVVAYGVGQVSVAAFDPETLTVFGVAAILISLAVAPVALSEAAAPPLELAGESMSMRELVRLVPTGVVTSLLVGIAHGSFIGLSAVYAVRSGLSNAEVGVFVAMPTLGGLVLQVPISSWSDRVDRRIVGAFTASAAVGAGALLLAGGADSRIGLLAMALIGGTTYPLYSIAGAYTNDWVPPERLMAVAAQLVLLYGAGAFVGPFVASAAMSLIGDSGYVWTAIGAHGCIAAFLAVRIAQWRPSVRAKPWNEVALMDRLYYLPATAASIGRRLRPRRMRG